MTGDAETFQPLLIPAEYTCLDQGGLDQSVHDLSYLYHAYAHDKKNGTTTASSFSDGLRLHELLDAISNSSTEFFG